MCVTEGDRPSTANSPHDSTLRLPRRGCRKKYSACIHAHVLARVAALPCLPLFCGRAKWRSVSQRRTSASPFCAFYHILWNLACFIIQNSVQQQRVARRPCNISTHVRTSSKRTPLLDDGCSTRESCPPLSFVELAAWFCAPTYRCTFHCIFFYSVLAPRIEKNRALRLAPFCPRTHKRTHLVCILRVTFPPSFYSPMACAWLRKAKLFSTADALKMYRAVYRARFRRPSRFYRGTRRNVGVTWIPWVIVRPDLPELPFGIEKTKV